MAIQNPSGLYSGGAVVVDQPNLGLYAQHLQKKQARDEALNQYFTELGDKINTAGVRMQDLTGPQGGINDEIAEWRKNWLANKDAIKKGGMAQQEHMAKLNQIIRKIDQSKQRGKMELDIGKAKFERKYDPDEDDINVLSNIGKSIYDPGSYKQDGVSEYGWQDLSASVPDFDAAKQKNFWDSATKGMQAGKIYDNNRQRVDQATGKVFVPVSEMYNPQQVQLIAENAADLVRGDRSAKKYYNRILDTPDSEQWQKLNSAYQSVFGANSIVSTPEQAAAADAILRAQSPLKVGEEHLPDVNRKEDFQREMADLRHRNSLSRLYVYAGLQANKPMSPNEIAMGIDNLIAGHIKSAAENNGELLVDAETYKSLTGQPQTRTSYLTIGPDGTYQYGKKTRELGADGKETGNLVIDQSSLKPVPFQLARGKLMESYPKTRPITTEQKQTVKEAASSAKKMVTVVLKDGRQGQIPEDKVAQFLKDNPGSKRQ